MAASILDIIKAPGQGILTFTTGSGTARTMLSPFFGLQSYDEGKWRPIVEEKIQSMTSQPYPGPYALIGIPSDCGGGICRGAAHGPLHLRHTLYQRQPALAAWDLGDVPCIPHLLDDNMLNREQKVASGEALWGEAYHERLPISPLNLLEEFLVELWEHIPTFRPLVLGGDHSVSGPVFNAMKRTGKLHNLAVLHFDAHTDLLEKRYGVAHCFATWTSHAVRLLDNPAAWIQLGIRASGHNQEYWENQFGLKQYWAKQCCELAPEEFAKHLIDHWQALGCTHLYITNDIDGTDARYAPSTGTPESGGLEAEWVRIILRYTTKHLPLLGSDLTEVAPVLGSREDARTTLETAVSFLESLHWPI